MVCKLLCLLILVTFVTQGYGCDRSNLTLKQSQTGNLYKDVTEWEVRLTNPCPCDFKNVKLSCAGFQSVTTIDKSVLSKSGNDCLLIDGQAVGYKSDYVFTYVWATSFDFSIIDAAAACT
ncbi:unnamed protein product [Eruca vesicaria subsp. sativa]|uniref:Uncharacterized protein n=1 Tax=Eruca vesicaria subsp. sativa TaxID=29727 RepID=A0ABC8K4Q3_ERUVS|nr:unnamed protein product [Eruca vesicaria subsp. sativa]